MVGCVQLDKSGGARSHVFLGKKMLKIKQLLTIALMVCFCVVIAVQAEPVSCCPAASPKNTIFYWSDEGCTFDGATYIKVPSSPKLDNLKYALAITATINLLSTGVSQWILSKQNDQDHGINLFVNEAGNLDLQVGCGGSDTGWAYFEVTSQKTIIANITYRVVGTYQVSHRGTTISLKINGCLDNTITIPQKLPAYIGTDDVYLGAIGNTGTPGIQACFFKGTIRNVSINNHAPSQHDFRGH